MNQFLRTAWGSDKSRLFKIGSWVVAIGAFATWNSMSQPQPVVKAVKNANPVKK